MGRVLLYPYTSETTLGRKRIAKKLWDDLTDLATNNRVDHFLGTLVTIGNSEFQAYTVIDGQQRLTTVSILLKALHSYLGQKEIKADGEETLQERILNDFLIDKYSTDKSQKIRLKPNKQDRAYFERLFEQDDFRSDSNIVTNFRFFLDRVSEASLTSTEIFEAFRRLKIVLINLDRSQDDPQLIFESLNSTGVDLTAGDLIRNYILMDLEPEAQESMYKKYWIEIEQHTGDVAEFVRIYLIFKLRTTIKRADVYPYFKKFAGEAFNEEKESILQDLLRFAKIYTTFVQINPHTDREINRGLERLQKLEFTVCHPYLMDVFNDHEENRITAQTITQVLKTIESHAFRKVLVDNSTQGLNKMYVTLAREIKKEPSWQGHYVDVLNYILREKRVSQRVPTDEEFETALINKEIYRLQTKNKNFLLESLENHNTAYRVDADNLSVEHIMPQTLTKDWKERLGKNWEVMHQKYLHTLGNLTLTAKNTELSNHTFEQKQKVDFETSKMKLNQGLPDLSTWDENTILNRAKKLANEAKEIWIYPQSGYSRPIPEEQMFDLTTEDSFSNLKPSRLFLENDEEGQPIEHWRDMLLAVINLLYEFSPTEFNQVRRSSELKRYFDKEKPLSEPLEFRPDIFVEGRLSTNNVISLLRKLCKYVDYNPENIQFSIKD